MSNVMIVAKRKPRKRSGIVGERNEKMEREGLGTRMDASRNLEGYRYPRHHLPTVLQE
jgi:hypothetical protein